MIELKLKSTAIRLDFSFFAVIALFLFVKDSLFGLAALTACAFHELSHLAVMAIIGIPADKITFYGAGIRITSRGADNAPIFQRILVLSAGAAANFAAAAFFRVTGNDLAAVINLFTGIFNLLPFGELDGAALLKIFVIKNCRPENVDKITRRVAVISAVAAGAVLLILLQNAPFVLCAVALYIVILACGRI